MKTTEEPERAQVGLLDHVLRVVLVPRQPPRQVVRGVQMRHDCFFEVHGPEDLSGQLGQRPLLQSSPDASQMVIAVAHRVVLKKELARKRSI